MQINQQLMITDLCEHRKGQLSMVPKATYVNIDKDSAVPGGEVEKTIQRVAKVGVNISQNISAEQRQTYKCAASNTAPGCRE
eukprot:4624393-Pleurochrysis_carterae.AAC.3